jgi:ribosomal protein S18 acetylase RimI-like enzyme
MSASAGRRADRAVHVSSLGFRTDLALLERAGSTIEDRGDHLVVRSPANPGFYWGNFLLLDHVPDIGRVEEWLDRFEAVFPEAEHRSFGFDVQGTVDDLSGFAEQGLDVESSTVMTASSVRPPAHPNGEAEYRAFQSDNDWLQSVELRIACDGSDQSVNHREFVTRRASSNRAVVEDGHGRWFGAFLGDTLVAQMGLVTAAPGLARFQSVETHPEYRGRGLAGTLAHHVSGYGFGELGAETLVIVADPDYLAIRIYRAIGFTGSEVQLQAERAPDAPGSAES